RDLFNHLRATNLYPDAMLLQTTDNEFRTNTRLMADHELGGSIAPGNFISSTGATLMVHESEMNNGADRIGLAGKTMTDEEFRHHLEDFFSKALNQKFTIDPPKQDTEDGDDEKPPGIFVFAASDPIRIR